MEEKPVGQLVSFRPAFCFESVCLGVHPWLATVWLRINPALIRVGGCGY
jgi:hypothetical protein